LDARDTPAAARSPSQLGIVALTLLLAACCATRGRAQAPAGTPPAGPSRPSVNAPVPQGGPRVPAPDPYRPVAGDRWTGPGRAGPPESAGTHEVVGGNDLQPSCPPPKQHVQLEASWEDGLRLASSDDKFHLHVGGNAQIDSTWLIAPKGLFAIPGGGMNGD